MHGLSEAKAQKVWEAITLHTSPELAERKGPEAALVQLGAACDMMGIGYDQPKPEQIAALIEAFPREGIQASFLDLILREVVNRRRILRPPGRHQKHGLR